MSKATYNPPETPEPAPNAMPTHDGSHWHDTDTGGTTPLGVPDYSVGTGEMVSIDDVGDQDSKD